MTVPLALAPAMSTFESWRIRRGTALYLFCLLTISTGYYLYWWLWKLKAYFIAWLVCLLVVVTMWIGGRLRLDRIGRDLLPILVWYGYLFASAAWSPSPSTTLYYTAIALVNVVAFIVSYAWVRGTSERALA